MTEAHLNLIRALSKALEQAGNKYSVDYCIGQSLAEANRCFDELRIEGRVQRALKQQADNDAAAAAVIAPVSLPVAAE